MFDPDGLTERHQADAQAAEAEAAAERMESEEQLVHRARVATSDASWTVGECAHLWTERFSRGRTDADFAKLIGMSAESVAQRRRVFSTFGDVRKSYRGLRFSHFRAAVSWDDSAECLAWACENAASWEEMTAWRRMQHGEDLTAAADPLPEELETNLPEMETETGETYAPFRAEAATPADGPEDDGGTTSGPPGLSADLAIKRIIHALERSARLLDSVQPDAFQELPAKLQKRFHAAVERVTDEAGALPC